MVGEAPVGFAVQLDDVAPDAAEQLGSEAARDAVARVHHDPQPARGADRRQHAEVVLARVARRRGPVTGANVLSWFAVLDLVLGEGAAPVVSDGVVAARDGGAASSPQCAMAK